jgi:hypothetical protein
MKCTPKLNKVHHIDSIQDMLIKSAGKHGDKLALVQRSANSDSPSGVILLSSARTVCSGV